jgi:2-haloacid dehalogenase
VYGTLFDPLGIEDWVKRHVGDQSTVFVNSWREKQLEYTFRRTAMDRYKDFDICTRQALDFVCDQLSIDMPEPVRRSLLALYESLPVYDDVAGTLASLRALGIRMYAFSNGRPDTLQRLFNNAGLTADLDSIVSVNTVGRFKPHPAVYDHFARSIGEVPGNLWLVSGNAFDVLGARNVSWNAAWLNRHGAKAMDPWELQPTKTIVGLQELVPMFAD